MVLDLLVAQSLYQLKRDEVETIYGDLFYAFDCDFSNFLEVFDLVVRKCLRLHDTHRLVLGVEREKSSKEGQSLLELDRLPFKK